MAKFDGEINSYIATSSAMSRYRFVKEVTDGRDSKCAVAAATNKPIGIATESVAEGLDVPVCETGHGLLEVNGNSVNIAIGDPLKPTTGGVGVKAATDGDFYGAIAKEAATTDGAIIRVSIERGHFAAA